DQQQSRETDFAGLRVDVGANLGLLAIARTRRLLHRVLHRGEHDRTVDRFFASNRVDDLQKLKPVGANGHLNSPSWRLKRPVAASALSVQSSSRIALPAFAEG